jgi:hypothetical protein
MFVEYAKDSPEDTLIRITACNRGPESARLHLLPTLWFRNTWSWKAGAVKPVLREDAGSIRACMLTWVVYPLLCGFTRALLPKMRPTSTACGANQTLPRG